MPSQILADVAASVSELKKNPMATVASGEGFPVAILNHNEPVFYCVPAAAYERLMEQLEDMELAELVKTRQSQPEVAVGWDEL